MPELTRRKAGENMPSNKACPAPDCRAANPPQRDVSADLALHGETAEWARSAMVCGYCGCVYTGYGNERRIRGHLGQCSRRRRLATKCPEALKGQASLP